MTGPWTAWKQLQYPCDEEGVEDRRRWLSIVQLQTSDPDDPKLSVEQLLSQGNNFQPGTPYSASTFFFLSFSSG